MTSPGIVITATVSGTVDQLLTDMMFRLEVGSLEEFLMHVMDPYVRERIHQRFESEGDDVSGPWDPLAYPTQRIRQAGGFPPDHPINVRTGLMERFLTQVSDLHGAAGGEAWMQWPGSQSDPEMLEKIKTAQSGKASPPTSPRPVLGFNEADHMFLATELVKHMLGI